MKNPKAFTRTKKSNLTIKFLACVIFLSAPLYSFAQEGSCTSGGSLFFRMFGNANDVVNFRDNADYEVVLGSSPNSGRPGVMAAIYRNGVCKGIYYGWESSAAKPIVKLERNTGICFGSGDDTLNVLTVNQTVHCGSSALNLKPFPYNGYQLTIRTGSGNDSITTGSGRNLVYAGNGNDIVTHNGNNETRVYGGGGNDTIQARDYTDGGSGNDQLIDFGGDADRIIGGSGNDNIYTCGSAVIRCGSGYDTLSSPSSAGRYGRCENWQRINSCN